MADEKYTEPTLANPDGETASARAVRRMSPTGFTVLICPTCKKEFRRQNSQVRNTVRGVNYCSHACRWGFPYLESAESRFFAVVEKGDKCWEWKGVVNKAGYGFFAPQKGCHVFSHRFSWEMHFGPIPDGLFVLHRCDNPPCVRPDHLFLGTDMDNSTDKILKNRHAHGSKHGQAKLDECKVAEIRRIYNAGGVTKSSLARTFGVSNGVIREVIRGDAWKHVTSAE